MLRRCCSATGATVTETRDDYPEQYRAEGSLCVGRDQGVGGFLLINEGQGRSVPGGGILPFGLGKHQLRPYTVSCRYHP